MKKFYFLAVLATVAVFLVAILTTGGTNPLLQFLSVPSFLIVVLPAFALSLANFSLRELGRCFSVAFGQGGRRDELVSARSYFGALGKYLMISGIIGFFTGAIVLLVNLGGDPSVIGAGTAVSLLTVVYAAFFYMIVPVPFRVGLDRRLAELEQAERRELVR
ncbi:MAG: hypothetical protein ACOC2D_13315 [Spirochaetota bacterium]